MAFACALDRCKIKIDVKWTGRFTLVGYCQSGLLERLFRDDEESFKGKIWIHFCV